MPMRREILYSFGADDLWRAEGSHPGGPVFEYRPQLTAGDTGIWIKLAHESSMRYRPLSYEFIEAKDHWQYRPMATAHLIASSCDDFQYTVYLTLTNPLRELGA